MTDNSIVPGAKSRGGAAAIYAALILSFLLACTADSQPPPSGTGTPDSTWRALSGLMRRDFPAVAMSDDGLVLIFGGFGGAGLIAEVESFDPQTSATWKVGSLVVPRQSHSATLLRDGRVLIAGGVGADSGIRDLEIYEPKTGRSIIIGTLKRARIMPGVVRLPDGRVAIAGGDQLTGGDGQAPTIEIVDPTTGASTIVGVLPTPMGGATNAVLLADGRVFLTARGAAAIVDMASVPVVMDASVGLALSGIEAGFVWPSNPTVLRDGSVLITGGCCTPDGRALSSAVLFDPVAKTLSYVPAMATGRFTHSSTLLQDGTVLIAGGSVAATEGSNATNSVELFDPSTRSFVSVNPMVGARSSHAAMLLPDGSVLVVGFAPRAGTTAEVYAP